MGNRWRGEGVRDKGRRRRGGRVGKVRMGRGDRKIIGEGEGERGK